MRYACQVWGQSNIPVTEVTKIQNKTLKIINFKSREDPCNPLYASSKILKFKDLITLNNSMFVFDKVNNILPEAFSEYFTSFHEIHHHNTRGALEQKINFPINRTVKYGSESIITRSIRDWNKALDNPDLHSSIVNSKRNVLTKKICEMLFNFYIEN